MVKGRCPACQTRVSETATNCPYCGYQDNELHIPIVLSKYTPFRRAWDVTEVRSPIDRLIVEQIMSTESFQQVWPTLNKIASQSCVRWKLREAWYRMRTCLLM